MKPKERTAWSFHSPFAFHQNFRDLMSRKFYELEVRELLKMRTNKVRPIQEPLREIFPTWFDKKKFVGIDAAQTTGHKIHTRVHSDVHYDVHHHDIH